MAFVWAGSTDGSEPIVREFIVKDTIIFTRGEMAQLDTGEVDAGATADTELLGPAQEDVDNTADGLKVNVIINPGAIYSVVDANARTVGDLLDLAAGGLGLAATSNNEFKVYKTSTATEPTLVVWNNGIHSFRS